MPNYLSPVFNEQTFNATGSPLVGGQIETYIAGTSTPLASYTTQNGTTQQSNPIILNSRGEPTNPIWLGSGLLYKFILKDAVGVSLRTIDNVGGVNDSSLSVSEWVASGVAPTFISTTSFSVVGDRTADFTPGRRTRSTNSGGTVYSTISAVSYSIGTGLTTVTVVNDSTPLDAGLSAVDVGILNPAFRSYPANGQEVRIDVASAATVNLTTSAPSTRNIRITGTTTITAFTVAAGQTYFVVFGGSLTLTNNANIVTNLGANVITSPGDSCVIRATAANTVEIINYETVPLDSLRIDVASATTVDIATNAPTTRNIQITGTTTITGFTVAAGRNYLVRFAGSLTLTNNANIVTQTGANIVTQTGDTCILRATAANTVEVVSYVPAVLNQQTTRSMVRLNTSNGYGSTATAIRRFTNVQTNVGSDITYTDSATNGASFTINTPGVYSVSFSDSGTTSYVGLSLNASSLTAAVNVLTATEILAYSFTAITNGCASVSWTGRLNPGDIVRPHNNGVANTGGPSILTITRVA